MSRRRVLQPLDEAAVILSRAQGEFLARKLVYARKPEKVHEWENKLVAAKRRYTTLLRDKQVTRPALLPDNLQQAVRTKLAVLRLNGK